MQKNLRFILQSLLLSYLATFFYFILLSVLLYFLGMSKETLSLLILPTYPLSTFLGAFLLAKKEGNKRLLWGCLLAFLYYLLYILLSIICKQTFPGASSFLYTFLLCMGGGAIGGILGC